MEPVEDQSRGPRHGAAHLHAGRRAGSTTRAYANRSEQEGPSCHPRGAGSDQFTEQKLRRGTQRTPSLRTKPSFYCYLQCTAQVVGLGRRKSCRAPCELRLRVALLRPRRTDAENWRTVRGPCAECLTTSGEYDNNGARLWSGVFETPAVAAIPTRHVRS